MATEGMVLVLYDSVLFEQGHQVARWAHRLERRFTENAIAEAPVNKRMNKSPWYSEFPPGSLKASIHGSADRIGPKHWQVVLYIDVPYAKYVLDGTQGPITPTHGKYMVLPPNVAFGTSPLHKTVSGQDANNFLQRAHAATAIFHPSIRGLSQHFLEQW